MKKSLFIITLLLIIAVLACGCSTGKTVDETNISGSKEADNIQTPEPLNLPELVVSKKAVEEYNEADYTFAPAELYFDIPKGFKKTKNPGEYLSRNFAKDRSSVNYLYEHSTEDPTKVSEEEFKKNQEDYLVDLFGDDLIFCLDQYDKIVIDGRPGLWIRYHYDFRGETFDVLFIELFNGDISYYITYIQGPDADFMDKFIESAETIKFKNK